MPTEISIPNILVRWIAIVLVFAILLFVPAGTMNWPEAWIFLGLYITFSIVVGTWMWKNNPGLLVERLHVEKRPGKGWDAALLLAIAAFFIAIFVLAGIDVFHTHWSSLPVIAEAFGFVGIALAWALVFLVMKENPFVSRTVQVTESQKVISSGPYRFVRHPMYVGAIVFFLCIPIALGSLYAILPASVGAALFVARTYMEDKTLQKEFEGYKEYAKKVRYRLLPGVW